MREYGQLFASAYDDLMSEIPYELYRDRIVKILRGAGIDDGLVAELGCGTGRMTRLLAASGYDCIGIDRSEEMLAEAMGQPQEEGQLPILWLHQDMRAFELYGTVRAFVSVADTMNYLTDPEDLYRTLKLVNNYLDPEGLFVFDLKTTHFFRDCLGNRTFFMENDDTAVVWDNAWYERDRINSYELHLFHDRGDGLYERDFELHEQRAYPRKQIAQIAERAGMVYVGAIDADTGDEWNPDTRRGLVILREKGKRKEG